MPSLTTFTLPYAFEKRRELFRNSILIAAEFDE